VQAARPRAEIQVQFPLGKQHPRVSLRQSSPQPQPKLLLIDLLGDADGHGKQIGLGAKARRSLCLH
jgi:hypothetical protein